MKLDVEPAGKIAIRHAAREVRVSGVQSNYIPWKGYFHIIQKSDVFVCLEDVQYTVRDWRNRNRVKLPDGRLHWLSVPVHGSPRLRLREVRIDHSTAWRRVHLETLRLCYTHAPFFDRYFPALETLYRQPHTHLVDLNFALLQQIAAWLGITTRLVRSGTLECSGRKDDMVISVVQQVGGTCLISGPAARAYMVPENYARAGIEIEFMRYDRYPEYPQLASPFVHEVSVLDLLFMTGDDAPRYIWGDRAAALAAAGEDA